MKRTTPRPLVLSLVVLSSLTLSSLASAEPKAGDPKNDRGYAYTFTDDSMLGSGIASTGIMIPVLAKARKDVLIRPRLQFVQQMIKSVENL